ncbi:hypothetical protein PWT90_04250 [Aphanocladium album]|nr:hypothetical protein PWT90_04250 [Aphanocladium album]
MTLRRQSVAYQACKLCRQRKRKCNGDGTNPCKACQDVDAECEYISAARVSKQDLRKELARLKAINSHNSALLDAISSKDTSPEELNSILQRLSNGEPRSQIAMTLLIRTRDNDANFRGMIGRKSLCTFFALNDPSIFPRAPRSPTTPSVSPVSPTALLSDTPGSSISSLTSIHTPPTGAPTLEAAFRASLYQYRLQLPLMLDTILRRDCLSFCPINKELLFRDFHKQTGLYCSAALIDALLALATLLAPEQMVTLVKILPLGSGKSELGDAFAQESIAALYNGNGLPKTIADIQALGILSWYCIARGKMSDGQGFGTDFCAAITDRWRSEQSLQSDSTSIEHLQMHANLYCAAVSLNRSLQWYESFFAYTSSCGTETPLLLFSQTGDTERGEKNTRMWNNETEEESGKNFWIDWLINYLNSVHYQFCMLCLLTPHILETDRMAADGTTAMAVCRQSAYSIQELVLHYGKLYNGGQLLDFMPSFKSAANSFTELYAATNISVEKNTKELKS